MIRVFASKLIMFSSKLQHILCLLVFCLTVMVTADSEEATSNVITIPPKSVNVSLNKVAEFNCTIGIANVAPVFSWKANNKTLTTESDGISIEKITITSILRITVSSTDNATNITCTAVIVSPVPSKEESEPALLLVQGQLDSVSNLSVITVNSTTVLISWSPPFTLEGVPILGYNATINNSTSIIEESTVEGSATMLYYTINNMHLDQENNFTVTLIPINDAGPGHSAMIVFFHAFPHQINTTTTISTSATTVFSNSSAISTSSNETSTVQSVYATMSSSMALLINSPDSSGSEVSSALVVALAAVSAFAVVIIVLCIMTVVILLCCCHHRINYTITIKAKKAPSPDVQMPAVSDNPAYKLVTVLYKSDNPKDGSINQSTANSEAADYEEIEEVYFKHTVESTEELEYEPIECRL